MNRSFLHPLSDQIARLRQFWSNLTMANRVGALTGSTVAVGLLMALLVMWQHSRDPRFTFPFSGLTQPSSIRTLCRLAEEIDGVEEWVPASAHEDAVESLAGFLEVALTEQATAVETHELLRQPDSSGGSRLNPTVLLIASQIDSDGWVRLRAEPIAKRKSSLKRYAEQAVVQRRKQAKQALLSRPEAQELLQSAGASAWPSEIGWLRRTSCWMFRKAPRDRELWLDEFLAAIRPLQQRERWYARLEGITELPFATKDHSGLWLRRTAGTETIRFNGHDSRLDFTLWLRFAGSAAPGVAVNPLNDASAGYTDLDTGLRFFGVNLDLDEKQEVHLRHPLPRPLIHHDLFAGFLRALGVGNMFALRELTVQPEGEEAFTINLTLHHRELPGFSFQTSLQLQQSGPILENAVRSLHQQAVERLCDHVRQMPSFDGLQWKITDRGDEGPMQVRIHLPESSNSSHLDLPRSSVSLCLSVTDRGNLTWSGMPTLEESAGLVKTLATSHPTLSKCKPLLTLDSVTVNGSPAILSGRLRVQGKAAGLKEDRAGVRWWIAANGSSGVQMTEDVEEYLRECATILGRTAPPPGTPAPNTTRLKRAIETLLQRKYPEIKDQVKVVTLTEAGGRAWLRLGVTIGDWPTIELDPVPLQGEAEIEHRLEVMLGARSVQDAAARVWGGQWAHPKYGKVRATLTEWSPEEAKARVACRLLLPFLDDVLTWDEAAQFRSDRWIRDRELELGELLEGKIATIEEQLRKAFREYGNLDIELGVDRNGFGPNRWLQLAPPALKLRGRIVLPYLNSCAAGADGIRIDQEGVHWPEKVYGCYLGTFPLGSIAISDPKITLKIPEEVWRNIGGDRDWRAAFQTTVLLGAKITPPVPPTPPGVKEQTNGQVRLDNPWLPFFYVEADLGGRIANPRFEAKAEVKLLRNYTAATANLEADLSPSDSQRLVARLETGTRIIPELPRLDGELRLSRREGCQIEAGFSCLGVDAAGRFRYRWESELAFVDVVGYADVGIPVPGFGLIPLRRVRLHGQTDLGLRKYDLVGRASMNVPWPAESAEVEIRVHWRDGVSFRFYWEDGGQTAEFTVEVPSLNALSENALQQAYELSQRKPKKSTEAERRSMSYTPPKPLESKSYNGESEADAMTRGGTNVGPAAPEDEPRPAGGGSLEVSPDGEFLRFHVNDRVLLRVKSADLGLKDFQRCWYCIWFGETRRTLLVFDRHQDQLFLARCLNDKSLDGKEDLWGRLGGLKQLFPPNTRKIEDCTLGWYTTINFVDLMLRGANLEPPTRDAGGCTIVERDRRVPGGEIRYFSWIREGGYRSVVVQSHLVVPAEQNETLWRRLSKLAPERQVRLIAATEKRLALLEAAEAGQYFLYLDPEGAPGKKLPLEVIEEEDAFDRCYAWTALAAWKHDWSFGDCIGWIGPEGGCINDGSDFWLLPTRRPGAAQPDEAIRLTRKQFDDWSDESVRLLPRSRQTVAARKALKSEEVARLAVRDWRPLRQEGWGANPMGLLVGLASPHAAATK